MSVHYDLLTDRIIYCHFIAIRDYKEFIHLLLKDTDFAPYIKINNKLQKITNNETNISMICENNYGKF
jgi:hypothetical protein